MSTTAVTLSFGGKDTLFHITDTEIWHMELAPLPRAPGMNGPSGRIAVGPLYARILRGQYRIDGADVGIAAQAEWASLDLDRVIFYGLVGGGKDEDEAAHLLRTVTRPMPLMQRWDLAFAILGARFEGDVGGGED
ncbi:GTA-gp10 family protein [Sphingomonas sp. 8AM]|uniref:GTA-gp10 family protein n=1 Tax=Sphingomonas sp. 8AM TaxID=2653170 RepID=UPI0012F2A2E2|nr:GTA-gp10 family protein [Sphingomonas sp. 8AM]VXC98224.1 conserved hypothetical protein [Sphingomonas sp. 8AM]